MEKQYKRERAEQERKSRIAGVVLAAGLNLALLLTGSFSGFKYLYPMPDETPLVLDFTEVEEVRIKPKTGRQPRAEEAELKKRIELVKMSEAQHEGSKENLAEEATVGPEGDVEVTEPPRKEINKKALFSSANNKAKKDTLAAQTARKVTDALSEGHAHGNTLKGKTDGRPNAHLKGRHLEGNLPLPAYNVQKEGIVVVRIWVDNYGKVTKAIPDGEGTTIYDKDMLNAARNAALKAHFNMSSDSPVSQEGQITYVFKLN